MMKLDQLEQNSNLFLDRDGVINKRLIDQYVSKVCQFEFLPGVLDAFALFHDLFQRIIIVTNQQGIGKDIMTEEELDLVHAEMMKEIVKHGGRVDRIYHCPDLEDFDNNCRKPGTKMAYMAKEDFPELEFSKSFMVGDQASDIQFGNEAGMTTVLISEDLHIEWPKEVEKPNYKYHSLIEFSRILKKK